MSSYDLAWSLPRRSFVVPTDETMILVDPQLVAPNRMDELDRAGGVWDPGGLPCILGGRDDGPVGDRRGKERNEQRRSGMPEHDAQQNDGLSHPSH
jgi:hypothetical protein